MFIFSKPNDVLLKQFVSNCREDRYSYSAVGVTATKPPPGYDVDHNRRLIGNGTVDFEAAKRAIDQWKMFDFEWVRLYADDTTNSPGKNVAMVAQHMGFY